MMVDGFGWELVFRGPTAEFNGERAVLDAGTITVTLLEPANSGDRLVSDRTPRVTQFVVGGDDAETAALTNRLTALGLPTHEAGPGRRFVPPEVIGGVLGFETAVVVQSIDDSDGERLLGDDGG